MSDGIEIPGSVVTAAVLAVVAAIAAAIWVQIPEARRYFKIETM